MRQWQDYERPADGDWGHLAHGVALAHVDRVERAEACAQGECEEHDPDVTDERCEQPAYGLGCNVCSDCIVRETLAAGWPVIEAAIRSGDFDSPKN